MGSQLQMSVQPVFSDLADSALAANNALTEANIRAVSRNAKYGCVRCETLYGGFYKNGDVIPLPVSPVDYYVYGATELQFDFALYCSRGPGVGFISGQTNPPPISFSQPGNPFWWTANIDSSRVVQTSIAYADGTSASHDGIMKVNAIAQRNASLVMAAIPVYLDIPNDVLQVAQPLRTGNAAGKFGIVDISRNAKFGCVRTEIIPKGFWAMGYTVTPPVSPVDGYQYSVTECIFRGIPYSNLAPAGSFANAQTTAPTLGNGQLARDAAGKGPLYWWIMDIDPLGNTSSVISYFVQGGAETKKPNSGIFKVFAICQRGSING